MAGKSQVLYGGMHRLQENAVIKVKNHSHSVTAEVDVPASGADGVIMAQGGDFGGWSLYLKDGAPWYCYNFVGIDYSDVSSDVSLAEGTHQVRAEFTYDGGGPGKGGAVALFVDGDAAGSGRVERTHKFQFSMDETADIGEDDGPPVADDYSTPGGEFTGKINWLQIDIDAVAEAADHLLEPEERFRIAMAKP